MTMPERPGLRDSVSIDSIGKGKGRVEALGFVPGDREGTEVPAVELGSRRARWEKMDGGKWSIEGLR